MDYRWAYRYAKKHASQRWNFLWSPETYDVLGVKLQPFTAYHNSIASQMADGIYEETPLFQDWIGYAKNASVIFDVGGFNGIYGLLAKKANPNATVYIFEPDEVNIYHIRENARINNLDIRLIPKAVSDHEGIINFASFGNSGSKIMESGEPTKCTRLSLYGAPDLMKLDVEGHEREALRGADLSRMKYLFVEMNHPLSLPAREIKRVTVNAVYEFA